MKKMKTSPSPCTSPLPTLRAIYVHILDYNLANAIIAKNSLRVSEGVGGSNGCYYEVNAPHRHVTFTKSLNDDDGADWGAFYRMIVCAGVTHETVWK